MLFYFPIDIPSYIKLQKTVRDRILEARGWSDVKKGSWTKECGQPQDSGKKPRRTMSPEPPGGMQPWTTPWF